MGLLRGAYGLRGWCRVEPFSAEAQVLRSARTWWLSPPGTTAIAASVPVRLRVTAVRAHGGGLVAKWRGCEDPETAESLKGWRVGVPRSAFPGVPPGQFYWVDLVGARVVNRAGQCLGSVQGLRNNGAHDLLVVAREEDSARSDARGNPLLIPVVLAYVEEIDPAAQVIRVDWDAQW